MATKAHAAITLFGDDDGIVDLTDSGETVASSRKGVARIDDIKAHHVVLPC
jgi:hypothetical protein